MAMQITNKNFNELLNAQKPLVLDFWAEWCGPCKMISPYVDELSETYKDQVSIGKVNVDEEETLADQFGIRNIPTLLFFKNGKIVDKLIGGVTKAAIEAKINALLQ